MLQNIVSKLTGNQFGHYKVVTRNAGKRGCTVHMCYSSHEARQVARKARQRGKVAQISVQGKEGWEVVED